MKPILFFFTILFLTFNYENSYSQKMENKKLGKILLEEADSLKGQEGYWQISYKQATMIIITDETHNRMRIISPIAYLKDLNKETYKRALEANFHTALDVKYAISEDIMWSVFIHPLKELSESQVKDALDQVYNASKTYGGSYSSTNLIFPSKN